MSVYLARLKQLESKNSHNIPNTEPPKPSKVPFGGFDGTGTGHIAKNTNDELNVNSQNITKGIPPKPPKVPFDPFGGKHLPYVEKIIIDDVEIITPLKRLEILLEKQREMRRQKVIAMLNAAPDTQRAIYTDTDTDPHNVILAVAVRACQQTCEMLIPKAKYDPWKLLELIERHGNATH